MLEGFKDRERRKARYIQLLISPHCDKNKIPQLYEITGFPEDAPRKLTKEEHRQEIEALMKELKLRR